MEIGARWRLARPHVAPCFARKMLPDNRRRSENIALEIPQASTLISWGFLQPKGVGHSWIKEDIVSEQAGSPVPFIKCSMGRGSTCHELPIHLTAVPISLRGWPRCRFAEGTFRRHSSADHCLRSLTSLLRPM